MPRDYKHRRTRRKDTTPGWVWGIGGLAIGLAVALAVHINAQRQVAPQEPVANTRAVPSSAREAAPVAAEEPGARFDFYDMLPKFEVVIPETESAVSGGGRRTQAVEQAGIYVLQAGSFRNFADADRMKAQLALMGMEPLIQEVTIDQRRWHRVRLGPYHELDELQQTRRQLRKAGIDVLLLRVGG